MAIATELNITTTATAMDMAQTIFGSGIQVVSASYSGDALSSGIYTGALSTIPGIVPSDTGVILSTGNVGDFTNSSGTTDTNTATGTGLDMAGGVDGDADLNAVSGQTTFDGAILTADFIPTGDMLTMQFVFSSEEYPEYVNGSVNDSFGVWVNGQFVEATISVAGNIAIDSVNNTVNSNLYRDNTADQFNTEMDGFTYVLSFKAPVNAGEVNTIKIGIADGGDAVYDSNLLIMGDSVQTYALAMDDTVQLTANSSRTFDILENDRDLTGSGLTITHLNGIAVVAGQTVTLATGEQVRLNADGTVTVFSDGDIGTNTLSYSLVDGAGNTDVGYIFVKTVPSPTSDGIVQGTTGDDVIQVGYAGDPDFDFVDNNDALGVGGTTGDADYILAGAGNDSIVANLGNDVIYAGTGEDSVYGGAGDDWASLGAGNDVFGSYGTDSGGNDTVYGDAGSDTITGGTGNDVLYGGTDNDTLSGGTGSDSVYGGDGADQFDISDDHEMDTLIGGEGGVDNDVLAFSNYLTTAGVSVTFTGNEAGSYAYDAIPSTYSQSQGSFSEIEGISGSDYNDTIDASANGAAASYSGNGGNDSIIGGSGNETIYGGDGDDSIAAGLGADSIYGDAGNDSLDGGEGNDLLYGGAGDDLFIASENFGNDTIYGGDGYDVVDFSGQMSGGYVNFFEIEEFRAGNYDNVSNWTSDPLLFLGGSANDTVNAGTGNDTLVGGLGNDVLNAGGGDDVVNADSGNDSVYGGAGNDLLTGAAGDDLVDGGDGDDTVQGDTGNDTLTGGAGADFIWGGDDADVIFGGVGDTVQGGEGGTDNDTLVLNWADVESVAYGGTDNESGTVTFVGGGTLSFSEIEHVTFAGPVDGTAGDDLMAAGYTDLNGDQVDGSDGANDTILGYGGNDTINAGIGDDLVYGGDGNDVLRAQSGNDTLYGDAGNDDLQSGSGNDLIYGGDGSDMLHVFADSGADTIVGGETGESVNGDILSFEAGLNPTTVTFTGDEAGSATVGTSTTTFSEIETISTGIGNDTIDASATTSGITVWSSDGDDLFTGGSGNDHVVAGAGNDLVFGGTGDDALTGDAGADSLSGGAGNDAIYGGTGNDTLEGGTGNDQLYGGDDRDSIFGGIGDIVDGGEGGDDFDVLDLTSWGHPATNIIYDVNNPENGTVQFLDGSGAVVGTLTFTNIESVVACFTPGAMILTDQGEVPVEDLVVGDRVLTRDNGYQPIRWIGRRDLMTLDLLVEPRFNPVVIAMGALGEGLPERDIMVSPQHRMLLSGPRAELLFGEHEVLVAAKHLVGMAGIEQRIVRQISYLHLLFDNHEILRADGAWSESFQPGDQTLAGIASDQREEIFALFPDLAAEEARPFPAARTTLKAREARVLRAM